MGVGDLNGELAEKVAADIGDAAIGIEFDAGDVTSVERLVATTVERFGRLDVLHNNAAIMAPDHIALDSNPVDIPFEIWDRTFAVNVRGYLAGVQVRHPAHARSRRRRHRLHALRLGQARRPRRHRLRLVEGRADHLPEVGRDDLRQAGDPLQRHQSRAHPHRGRQAQRARRDGRHPAAQHPHAAPRRGRGHRRRRGLPGLGRRGVRHRRRARRRRRNALPHAVHDRRARRVRQPDGLRRRTGRGSA